jgi:hypothetical protein
MPENPSFTSSREFVLLQPRKTTAFMLPVEEWEEIKSKVSQIADGSSLYHAMGASLLGFALSALLTAVTFRLAPPKVCPSQTNQNGSCPAPEVVTTAPEYVTWALLFTTAISGALSLYFGSKQSEIQRRSKEYVVSDMNLILKRYEEPS